MLGSFCRAFLQALTDQLPVRSTLLIYWQNLTGRAGYARLSSRGGLGRSRRGWHGTGFSRLHSPGPAAGRRGMERDTQWRTRVSRASGRGTVEASTSGVRLEGCENPVGRGRLRQPRGAGAHLLVPRCAGEQRRFHRHGARTLRARARHRCSSATSGCPSAMGTCCCKPSARASADGACARRRLRSAAIRAREASQRARQAGFDAFCASRSTIRTLLKLVAGLAMPRRSVMPAARVARCALQ